MNLLKRAFLYVTRKRGKSFLLFLIIFVISTLALCGLASLDAEEETSTELRGATGTSFSVERNLATGGLASDGAGNSYNTQELLSVEIIEKIAKTDGIESYNAIYTTILNFYDSGGAYYEIMNPTGYALADCQYYSYGSLNSEFLALFLSQTITLTEGRHITGSDDKVVMISKDIADKHGLKLGDKISAVNNPDGNDPYLGLEIVGIFDVVADKTDEKNNYDMKSYYDYSSYAFVDMSAMNDIVKIS